jgi:hypothetical protein
LIPDVLQNFNSSNRNFFHILAHELFTFWILARLHIRFGRIQKSKLFMDLHFRSQILRGKVSSTRSCTRRYYTNMRFPNSEKKHILGVFLQVSSSRTTKIQARSFLT